MSKKINNGTLESRKVLSAIQPETPARRTTFLVNKPQNHNEENSNETTSLSPLSFNKSTNYQPNKKIPIRKTKNSSNKENDRRQTFNVDTTSRNLFGNTTNNGSTHSKTAAAAAKPKPFLKRTSISQTLSSMRFVFIYCCYFP